MTKDCLESLIEALAKTPDLQSEIIVVDNASSDDSMKMLSAVKNIEVIENKENLGFGKANNKGLEKAQGRYVLFLNSDVLIKHVDFKKLVDYLDEHEDVGALTVKVSLENGRLDPASHRGFPTIWNSLTYFSKLEKISEILPILSSLLGQYHLTDRDLTKIHEIDSPSGAFYLSRKNILEELGGFDNDFFMYGEDLDLSYRIKNKGHKIMYYPDFSVLHLKYQSGIQNADRNIGRKTHDYFYNAMHVFYNKHRAPHHNRITNFLVHFFINLKKTLS